MAVMPYDDAFFERYRAYLAEPLVRKNHDRAFRLWIDGMGGPPSGTTASVIDLGCGTGEYLNFGRYLAYAGIDTTPRVFNLEKRPGLDRMVRANYYDVTSWKGYFEAPRTGPVFNAFVSLFSIEPVYSLGSRYDLYRRLFAELPDIKFGLSAGFYYTDKADRTVVEETGGLLSFQTVEPLGAETIPSVTEERLTMATPSAMFGDKVVEVYKFFTRNAS
jgi:SAM-dependent methyltransferase